jgi:hypothetical protein
VYLRRALADASHPGFPRPPFERQVAVDAYPTVDLDHPVEHLSQGFDRDVLRKRREVAHVASLVVSPRSAVDDVFRLVEVDSRLHELPLDGLTVGERFAPYLLVVLPLDPYPERLVDRAETMGRVEDSRLAEVFLGESEPLADRSEDAVLGHAHVVHLNLVGVLQTDDWDRAWDGQPSVSTGTRKAVMPCVSMSPIGSVRANRTTKSASPPSDVVLLAVDDPLVAVPLGAGLHSPWVRAGGRFGEAETALLLALDAGPKEAVDLVGMVRSR